MHATVIDTLRYADGLKAAGVEPRQAEAMSRALNDELVEGVATKRDLDNAVADLKSDIAKVDARFEAMDAKFDAMDAKFESLASMFGTQGRYVFLVLALIAALGLYNAAVPHFPGKPSGTAAAAASTPAAQTPGTDANA